MIEALRAALACRSRAREAGMVNVTRGGGADFGGSLPPIRNIRLAGSRILQIGLAIVVILLLLWSTTSIPTGNVGVLTLFGRVTGEVLPEGIHVINPLKTNNQLSIQTQTIKESASVPSSEGLVMNLDTSLIYHLNPDRAADVFQKIGGNYEQVVVEPTLRAAIREATAS